MLPQLAKKEEVQYVGMGLVLKMAILAEPQITVTVEILVPPAPLAQEDLQVAAQM
jgi:hypothetical protein